MNIENSKKNLQDIFLSNQALIDKVNSYLDTNLPVDPLNYNPVLIGQANIAYSVKVEGELKYFLRIANKEGSHEDVEKENKFKMMANNAGVKVSKTLAIVYDEISGVAVEVLEYLSGGNFEQRYKNLSEEERSYVVEQLAKNLYLMHGIKISDADVVKHEEDFASRLKERWLGGLLNAGIDEVEAQNIIQYYFDSLKVYKDESLVLMHGDLTPYNVMITGEGESLGVCVIDFGMAQGGLKYYDLARWNLSELSNNQLRETYKKISKENDSNFEIKCDIAKLRHHLIMFGFIYNALRDSPLRNKKICTK